VHDTTLSSLTKPHVNYRHLSRSTVYTVHSHFTVWRLQCNGCCYTSHWHSKSRICRHVKTTGVATIRQRYARHKTYTYRGALEPFAPNYCFCTNWTRPSILDSNVWEFAITKTRFNKEDFWKLRYVTILQTVVTYLMGTTGPISETCTRAESS
jgi:hypothetical protein